MRAIGFTHSDMSPRKIQLAAPPRIRQLTDRLTSDLGREVHDQRTRRGWTLDRLAAQAGVSRTMVQGVEAGEPSSVEGYVRLATALGLMPRFTLLPETAARAQRDADPVHAAMGEVLASHFRGLGMEVRLDEPYQHYQFAGRADLVVIERSARALLHVEDRTRFPDVQAAIGAYNGKQAYLAADLARRLAIPGGFRTITHVMVALWSSEVLHTLRLRTETFRSVCPDPPDHFVHWWDGRPPSAPGTTSSLLIFDPLTGRRSSRRRWVGLDDLRTIDPRYRGYADALEALRRAGLA